LMTLFVASPGPFARSANAQESEEGEDVAAQTFSPLSDNLPESEHGAKGNKGDLTYSYAFAGLPPGTGGLAPNLALVYSSALGNGPYGFGWALQGLGHIERATRKGLPDYCAPDDAACSDTFLLNGQTLIADPDEPGRYFFRQHDSSRILYKDGHWQVTSTDGTTQFFGSQNGNQSTLHNESGAVFRWALDKIRDPRGNTMNIHYQQTHDNDGRIVDILPAAIVYNDHDSATLPGAGHRLVQFSWCERHNDNEGDWVADIPTDFRPGFKLAHTQRLCAITAGLDRNTDRDFDDVDDEPVVNYALEYAAKTSLDNPDAQSFSQLLSIQSLGYDAQGNEVAFNKPTTFNYRTHERAFSAAQSVNSHLSSSEYTDNQLLDMNGDGLMDQVFIKNDQTLWVAPGQRTDAGEYTLAEPREWHFEAGIETLDQSADFAGEGIETRVEDREHEFLYGEELIIEPVTPLSPQACGGESAPKAFDRLTAPPYNLSDEQAHACSTTQDLSFGRIRIDNYNTTTDNDGDDYTSSIKVSFFPPEWNQVGCVLTDNDGLEVRYAPAHRENESPFSFSNTPTQNNCLL
ncbi:MAG: SpvB/TcaC N-terminal domain-containing protein, partial [Myxococcota bacterium]|nr:SpvB/TcaC N-terminal domain-containing protein [Myxococcota bacterium]